MPPSWHSPSTLTLILIYPYILYVSLAHLPSLFGAPLILQSYSTHFFPFSDVSQTKRHMHLSAVSVSVALYLYLCVVCFGVDSQKYFVFSIVVGLFLPNNFHQTVCVPVPVFRTPRSSAFSPFSHSQVAFYSLCLFGVFVASAKPFFFFGGEGAHCCFSFRMFKSRNVSCMKNLIARHFSEHVSLGFMRYFAIF